MGIKGTALAWTLALGIGPAAPDGRVVVYSRLDLEFQLPELDGVEQELRPAGTHEVIGVWRGKWRGSDVTIRFHRLASGPDTPREAVDHVLAARRERVAFGPLERRPLEGPFGRLAYGELLKAELRASQGEPAAGLWYAFGAVLEQGAYVIEFDLQPSPEESFEKPLLRCVRAIVYDGHVAAAQWSLADLRALWRAQAPETCRAALLEELWDERAAKKFVLRSDHYVVLSNAPLNRKLGRALENAYRRLDRLVELEEIAGRPLLPVLVFRERDQFQAWCAGHGASPEACAEAAAWVADGIYATWYVGPGESAREPELFAQLLGSRLGLDRHSPWLRAGVTGYLLSPPSERDEAAARLAGGCDGLFDRLLGLDGDSAAPGSGAAREAALLVEFLREGRVGKRSFPAFLRAAREVRPGDAAGLDEVVRRVYGMGRSELEERLAAYCAAR